MASLKSIVKNVTPPFVWQIAKGIRSHRTYAPRWNTLAFEPLKGIRIFFDPSGAWQKKMASGTYDSFLFDRIRALDPAGKVIYDVGAHIGFHSLYFSRLVGKTGTVATFEPNTVNYERLLMNIRENADSAAVTRPFNLAASDSAGTLKFTTNDNIESGRSTGGFLDDSDPHWSREIFMAKGFKETTVTAMPLDEMPSKLRIPEPHIMKIDVEGAEYQVLRGAARLIERAKPVIFVEIHSIAAMFDVTRFLQVASYDIELINKEANGVCYLEAHPKKA